MIARLKSVLDAALTALQEWLVLLLFLVFLADMANEQDQQELEASLDEEGFE